jgi:hypothetical protein
MAQVMLVVLGKEKDDFFFDKVSNVAAFRCDVLETGTYDI